MTAGGAAVCARRLGAELSLKAAAQGSRREAFSRTNGVSPVRGSWSPTEHGSRNGAEVNTPPPDSSRTRQPLRFTREFVLQAGGLDAAQPSVIESRPRFRCTNKPYWQAKQTGHSQPRLPSALLISLRGFRRCLFFGGAWSEALWATVAGQMFPPRRRRDT